MKKQAVIATSVAAGILVVTAIGGGVYAATTLSSQSQNASAEASTKKADSATTPSTKSPEAAAQSTAAEPVTWSVNDQLLFLMEEEKLAHDVYLTLGALWGNQIFSNIQNSEVSHQDQVAALLPTYGLTDPRSSEVGVFTNPDLQAFYDQLIAQGSQSVTEAFKAGVAIEERDIADLQAAIDSTQDPAILNVLQTLKRGSENHLRAFNRQL